MPSRSIRTIAGVATLLAALVIGAACGDHAPAAGAAAPPQRGGTAVMGSISDVDSWNEYVSRQTFANNLQRRIFLRLAQEMGDSKEHPATFLPQLAESWSASGDGKTITFRLRRATWSDGRPITASDVRFTWKAQVSPEVAWVNAKSKEHVTDVQVLDDRTAAFRFDRAYPDQLADALEGGILPEHVFGAVPFADWRTHDWSGARVSSGPFLLESHRPGEEIDLVRNARYFQQDAPLLDRVVVRIVPDATSLLTQLLAGTIDYVEGVAPREAERVRAARGVRLVAFDYPMYDYVGWNGARPPWNDPDVRRAMTLAIDRKALVEDLLYGYGRVGTGPFLSFWWGADPSLAPWPCDPAEARRILASKGFAPRSGDGVLVRDGKPLRLTLTTNAGNRLREAVIVKIQEQLSRVGIEVDTGVLEMQTFVHKNTTGDFDAYLGGWRFSGKIDLRPIFGSAGFPPAGSNVVRYRSAEVDRLLDALDEAADWREMKPVLSSIGRRIRDDQPYTFLYETRRLAAVGPRLQGVEIDIPFDPLAHLERWWVNP